MAEYNWSPFDPTFDFSLVRNALPPQPESPQVDISSFIILAPMNSGIAVHPSGNGYVISQGASQIWVQMLQPALPPEIVNPLMMCFPVPVYVGHNNEFLDILPMEANWYPEPPPPAPIDTQPIFVNAPIAPIPQKRARRRRRRTSSAKKAATKTPTSDSLLSRPIPQETAENSAQSSSKLPNPSFSQMQKAKSSLTLPIPSFSSMNISNSSNNPSTNKRNGKSPVNMSRSTGNIPKIESNRPIQPVSTAITMCPHFNGEDQLQQLWNSFAPPRRQPYPAITSPQTGQLYPSHKSSSLCPKCFSLLDEM